MKKFKYRFTRTITVLMIVGLVLCVVGFFLNLYYVIAALRSNISPSTYDIIGYVIMFFVTVFLGALLISLMSSSYYTVNDKYFITCFGFIKSKFRLEDIVRIVLDRNTNKLSVHFSDEQFTVIVVKEEWYEQFIDALREKNPKIQYEVESEERGSGRRGRRGRRGRDDDGNSDGRGDRDDYDGYDGHDGHDDRD